MTITLCDICEERTDNDAPAITVTDKDQTFNYQLCESCILKLNKYITGLKKKKNDEKISTKN
ncbi:hypothetical protein BH10BAC5_BH10BAC5_17160 [soil metagenome]